MLENISATNVELSPVFITGSSSTDGEDINFLNLVNYPARVLLRQSPGLPIDTASYAAATLFDIMNETFSCRETAKDKTSSLKLLFGSWIESGDEDKQINEIFKSRQISSGALDE